MQTFWYILVFIYGVVFGSFLNVVIIRIHEEIPWWKGRSKCPICKKNLTPRELIPLLSFIFQKGKCLKCKAKISLQYPLIELAAGLLLVFAFYTFSNLWEFALIGSLSLLLLGLFISDLKYMELPDTLSFSAIILALLYQYIAKTNSLESILAGISIGIGFFVLQYLLTMGKGIGTGDIRLGALMGALLGWPLLVFSILIAYISGSLISIILLVLKKANRKTAIPLGIFLIPALLITFIFKEQFIELGKQYFVWF